MYKDLFIVFWSFLVTNNSDNDERFLFRNDVEIQMYAIEQKFNFGSIILSLVKCKLNIKLNEQGIGKRYSGSGPQK
jgi:hypothetical protein